MKGSQNCLMLFCSLKLWLFVNIMHTLVFPLFWLPPPPLETTKVLLRRLNRSIITSQYFANYNATHSLSRLQNNVWFQHVNITARTITNISCTVYMGATTKLLTVHFPLNGPTCDSIKCSSLMTPMKGAHPPLIQNKIGPYKN